MSSASSISSTASSTLSLSATSSSATSTLVHSTATKALTASSLSASANAITTPKVSYQDTCEKLKQRALSGFYSSNPHDLHAKCRAFFTTYTTAMFIEDLKCLGDVKSTHTPKEILDILAHSSQTAKNLCESIKKCDDKIVTCFLTTPGDLILSLAAQELIDSVENAPTTEFLPNTSDIQELLARGYSAMSYNIAKHKQTVTSLITEKDYVKYNPTAVKTTAYSHSDKGNRKTQEDRAQIIDTDEGILLMVCDGHKGAAIAEKVCKIFKDDFINTLKKNKNDIPKTLTEVIQAADEKTIVTLEAQKEGSTGVFCYIDKKSAILYQHLIGDGIVASIHSVSGSLKCSPMTIPNGFDNPSTIKRFIKSCDNSGLPLAKEWILACLPIARRTKGIDNGVNMESAFGDAKERKHSSAFTCQPKSAAYQLKPGSIVIVGSDGLEDIVDREKPLNMFIKEAYNHQDDLEKYTKAIVKNAIEGNDNVTAIVCALSPVSSSISSVSTTVTPSEEKQPSEVRLITQMCIDYLYKGW